MVDVAGVLVWDIARSRWEVCYKGLLDIQELVADHQRRPLVAIEMRCQVLCIRLGAAGNALNRITHISGSAG